MNTSYVCIVINIFIPLVCAGYAKFSTKGYDNHHPRDFLAKLEGKGKRAHAAQQNAFEAFPPFAIGVIVAHQLSAPISTINTLAITFTCARITYCLCYIIDQDKFRSLSWLIALSCTIALYLIAL